jgi:hypothetical protein
VTEQPDDYLDAQAECLNDQPTRIGKGPKVGNPDPRQGHDWRPSAGVYEVTVEA